MYIHQEYVLAKLRSPVSYPVVVIVVVVDTKSSVSRHKKLEKKFGTIK